MSVKLSCAQVEESTEVLGYVNDYSQAFLVRFFNFLNKFIETSIYLNKEKTEWYLCEVDFERIFIFLLEETEVSDFDFHQFCSPKSSDEYDLVNEVCRAISEEKPQDILNLKINKKLAFGINGFKHNDDSRSIKSKNFLKEKNIVQALTKGEMTFDKNKVVAYFQDGFTVREYISEYLQVRGNPYDRWYTMYGDVVFPSKKKLEKMKELLNNSEINSNDCILFDFDFGS